MYFCANGGRYNARAERAISMLSLRGITLRIEYGLSIYLGLYAPVISV